MTSLVTRVRNIVSALWRTDAPLTATGLLMIGALGAAAAGLWLDPRTITGASAWLKPAKFAVSIAIYCFTLAWVFGYLPSWSRTRRIAGWTTAVTLIIEIAVISLQAWRGTTSHFNVGTALDGALFSTMGLAIVVQTLAAAAVAVALWWERFDDRALGWALRLGLTVTIVGASTGGLMVSPTESQLEAARTTRLTVIGAHTVGAPDGGPGMPGTGWSSEHGDLRVPHFLGLHALQAFALLTLALPRRGSSWPQARRVRILLTAAASYTSLFVLLLWQAVIGQAVTRPDTTIAALLLMWAITSAAAGWLASRTHPLPASAPAH